MNLMKTGAWLLLIHKMNSYFKSSEGVDISCGITFGAVLLPVLL